MIINYQNCVKSSSRFHLVFGQVLEDNCRNLLNRHIRFLFKLEISLENKFSYNHLFHNGRVLQVYIIPRNVILPNVKLLNDCIGPCKFGTQNSHI